MTYFVGLRQGTPDALWNCGNGQFFDNGYHRHFFLRYQGVPRLQIFPRYLDLVLMAAGV